MRSLLPALAVSLATLLTACSDGPALERPIRPVVVESPQPLSIEGAALYPGVVVAREDSQLGFRIAGKLTKRRVDAGDAVRAGQVLAEIDPEDARLASQAAEAAVRAAEADRRLAESEMQRHKELLERGFISASAFELRENQFKLAEARLRQIEAEAAVTRNQAQYTRIVADKPGLVTAVLAEPGQVLAAGQPVLRFVPDEGREVEIQVPEGRLDRLTDARLDVRLWVDPERVYAGRLREVVPQADALTRTHRVRIALPDADAQVKLGMTANVTLSVVSSRPLFGVAHTAVGQHEGEPCVWRVDPEGRVQPVPVEVVRYNEQGVIVSGELEAADALVTAGVYLLSAGETVRATPRRRNGG